MPDPCAPALAITRRSRQIAALFTKPVARPTFSIITPSFRQPDWLKLCAASIADQEGVEIEHVVQDAGTDDIGVCGMEIAAASGAAVIDPNGAETLRAQRAGYRLRLCVEKDKGMYDAVNRGLRKSTGEVCAYLNCDEQYFPGTLATVGDFFTKHPTVDVAFGDVVVTDSNGTYVCSRQALTPRLWHTHACTLCTFTAATFFRRSVFEKHGLFFSDEWRDIGDAAWVLELIRHRLRLATLGVFTSSFADTGENMNLKPNAIAEQKRMFGSAPWLVQKAAPLWVAQFRLRKLLAGHYRPKPLNYAVFTHTSPATREKFVVSKPTSLWASRLHGVR